MVICGRQKSAGGIIAGGAGKRVKCEDCSYRYFFDRCGAAQRAAKRNPRHGPGKALVSTTLSSWYREDAYKSQKLYEEKLVTEGDGDEARRLKRLANGFAERAIDAVLRPMNVNGGSSEKGTEIHRSLERVVRFRFNLPAEAPIDLLDGYFKKLIGRPLPDPATEVLPVRDDPPEIKLIRNGWQR